MMVTLACRLSRTGGRALGWMMTAAALYSMGTPANAQTAPGVTLACPSPTSSGVTANLSTAAGTWETSGDGGAWVSAAAYQHPAWTSTPPAIWIGAVTGTSFTAVDYRVMVNAADPYIDLASATVTYNYRVDNTVSGVTFNSAALTSSPSTTYNSASPYSSASQSVPLTRDANNVLTFHTTNAGNPWGLVANVTLTYNCVPPVVAPVPADAPWALLSLSGLMLAAVGFAARRRRRH
ncbi:MAG: hypothetical protein KDF56_16910 [Ottowia sp.]|nr:hypothetical protein [Ottowia sp.]